MSPLNDLQHAVLDMLCWRVRVSTEGQLAEKFGVTGDAIRRQLSTLKRRRIVESTKTGVCLLDAMSPLYCWPADQPPNFEGLAWTLKKRRQDAVRKICHVYWAAKPAILMVGGVGGTLRQRLQLTHDLGTATVFVRRKAEDGLTWISEDVYRRHYRDSQRLRKLPDALLVDREGCLALAIEIGGLYPADRLAGLHLACVRASLPYELW